MSLIFLVTGETLQSYEMPRQSLPNLFRLLAPRSRYSAHQRHQLIIASLRFSVYDSASVIIGSNVRIGPSVSIHTDSHGTDVLLRRQSYGFAYPVTISDDCWIGADVNILPGVTIGVGCTIGAGAVVTKDIPPYSVAIGTPARVIKNVEAVDGDVVGDGELEV